MEWKTTKIRLGWDCMDRDREMIQAQCERAAQAGGSFSITNVWTGREWMVCYDITMPDHAPFPIPIHLAHPPARGLI